MLPLYPLPIVLQVIIWQLSALIWVTSALSKSPAIQIIGLVLAIAFIVIGGAQAASFNPYLP